VAADQLISQIIPLRYVVFSDVQPVIQHLIHGYGKVIELQWINSVLVTDTSANVARIVEALEMLDQPLEKIEPRIYQLNHAKAGDIAGKLKELVEAARPESKPQQQVVARAKAPPGVIRAAKTAAGTVTAAGPATDDTQMVQGDVKFVSDERTNILIVFSKAANFDFFDRIIRVLDVPVDPEVVVETINLEYAESTEIAGILNDFVGAAKAEEETTKAQTGDETESGESRSINDVIARRTGNAQQPPVSAETASAIGRLSADTKIIADERTNSLILMGSKSDINALKAVIASLDIMLQQVLIEAVILNINLDDSIETGVEWIYDSTASLSERHRLTTGLSGIAVTNGLPVSVGNT
ncbi:MAG TPA: secretin N-terminal domain-containing protein, partial [Tichowtungia sp.]|nr:secretin N-terminal domain-containing protein [Tichowtungia sp.]